MIKFDQSSDCTSAKTFPKALSSGCQCRLLFLFTFTQLSFIREFNSPHWPWAHYVDVIQLQAVKTSSCCVCHTQTYCWHLNAISLPSKSKHKFCKRPEGNWFLWNVTKLSWGKEINIRSAVPVGKDWNHLNTSIWVSVTSSWWNSCISWTVVSNAKEVQDEESGCVLSSLPEWGHPSVPL